MSIERRKMLAFLGAEIVLTPAAHGMKGSDRDRGRAGAHHAQRRDAAAVQEPCQSRNSPPHHRGGNLERYRRHIDFFVPGSAPAGTITASAGVEAAQALAADRRRRA